MDIVVFGVGDIYRRNKNMLPREDRIVAFLDNDGRIQGKRLDGIEIAAPFQIQKITYDKIVLMSAYAPEMREQLLQLGCRRESVMHYQEYIGWRRKGEMRIFFAEKRKPSRSRCLILTTPLGYHGGAITAVYAALALRERGYEAVVAAPDGEEPFIREFQSRGITFFIYPNLQFASREELFWTDGFERIFVNTYPMMLCALELARDRSIPVWIHENDCNYPPMLFWREEIQRKLSKRHVSLYAVSDVAQKNFLRNVGECRIEVLPYGIPDSNKKSKERKKQLTFACIGSIEPVKRQLLFLEAVERLRQGCQAEAEFWIIGAAGDAAYMKRVEETSTRLCVKQIGPLQRKELEKLYESIDVLVVASVQESMSLVATEAMMYGKVCIVSDVTGMAGFIEHRMNGLVFRTDDIDSLTGQMKYCMEQEECLAEIEKNARNTYCQFFTMEKFGERLERVMDQS